MRTTITPIGTIIIGRTITTTTGRMVTTTTGRMIIESPGSHNDCLGLIRILAATGVAAIGVVAAHSTYIQHESPGRSGGSRF
jgi:hypothetical protein